MVEPWLRGTLIEVDAVRRQVLHALQLAGEDVERWCAPLTDTQIHARPAGISSVAFHLRHISGSLSRLLTYAEGQQLSPLQLEEMDDEKEPLGSADVLADFRQGLADATARIDRFQPERYEEMRYVGREQLESTFGGLLVHCAEHTQRHVGQAITTSQIAGAV